MSAQFLNAVLDGFDPDRCAALARRFRQAGTWQVPTLVVWKVNATGPFDSSDMPSADDVEARRRLYGVMLRMTKLLFDEGVPIMTGTDNVAPIQDEMAALVEAGLRPIDALRAATTQPARFLKMKSGVVKAGTAADLVLLENNPLEDIANNRRIAAVILRGQYIDVHKDAQNH